MKQGMNVLQSKLLIPRVSNTIKRERLQSMLYDLPQKRLITVTAGAGYGKTTLIAQELIATGLDTVWYRLDPSDRDLSTFLTYLIAGLRNIYPDIGDETSARMAESPVLSLEYEAVLTVFLCEIERVTNQDLVVVFDDYHIIQDQKEIRDSMQFLIKNLPPHVHFILTSRSGINLNLSRLRALREVIDITADDIAFTPQEIAVLFAQLFQIPLDTKHIETLHQKTDGWISALILFYHSLHGKNITEIDKLLAMLKGSSRIISEYLEENVYALLTQDIRSFLAKTSILPRLNQALCNRFLGIETSDLILKELQQRHLFTYTLDEEDKEYCYHHLFQDFLQLKLKQESSPEDLLTLYFRAAQILEHHGEKEAAIGFFLQAQAFDEGCRLLISIGIHLITQARLQLVYHYLEMLPRDYIDRQPWIIYLRACAHSLSGRYQQCGQDLENAFALFQAQGDQEGMDRCLNDMGIRAYLAGDFVRAEKTYLKLLKNDSISLLSRVEAMGHLVFISSYMGKMETADKYYNQALDVVPYIENDMERAGQQSWLIINRAYRYVASGEHPRAIEVGRRASPDLEKHQLYRLLALYYQLITTAHYYSGEFSPGLEQAMAGLDLIREKGFHDTTVGWLLCYAAANSLGLGRIEDAINYANDSLLVFRELVSPWGQGYAYHTLQDAYLAKGDLVQAEDMGRKGLERVNDLSLPLILGPIKASLADTLIQGKKYAEAEDLLIQAEQILNYSQFFDWWVARLYVRLYWETGRRDMAIERLNKGLALARTYRYDQWIIGDKSWLVPILVHLYAQGHHREYVQEIINTIGEEAIGILNHLRSKADVAQSAITIRSAMPKEPPAPLKVCCLGRLRIIRGKEEIPAQSWKGKNARMLFKLLIHYRCKGFVSKEVFMEHLWPEEDPEKTSKRFHVTLANLRKILEPDIERGTPSAYIRSDADTYMLDLGQEGSVDVDAFENECMLARDARETSSAFSHLLAAAKLYQGDFLAEDLYEQWCEGERERLKDLYLLVLIGLIDYYEHTQQHYKAIEVGYGYLQHDPFAEDIYQRLMRFHALTGNTSLIRKTYERCRETIVNDLGGSLSRETLMLARELMGNDLDIYS